MEHRSKQRQRLSGWRWVFCRIALRALYQYLAGGGLLEEEIRDEFLSAGSSLGGEERCPATKRDRMQSLEKVEPKSDP
jgi:hypothetical protein